MCPTGTTSLPRSPDGGSPLRPAFEVLDADSDGRISRDDLRALYAAGFCHCGAPEDEVIATMMSVADKNSDGYVEYEEFERVLKEREGGEMRKRGVMEEAFRVMDRDGDGRVGHDDLREFFQWAGLDAGEEEIRAMIRLGGGDERQGVTYDGLLKILAI
ncbi:hypothetical protein NMG60_11032981 [Bertholletia excelsa]